MRSLRAFTYIHRTDPDTGRKPLVHSDVTPHNILIDPTGAVKLSDFGLARALRRTGAEVITRARGKDSYLSPEQWLGEPVGAKSDLFSLGLVLWKALLKTHPYAAGRPMSRDIMISAWVQNQTVENHRRLAVEAAPDAPPELTQAIDRLLQPSPQRMATADELYAVLSPLVPYDAHERLAQWVAA